MDGVERTSSVLGEIANERQRQREVAHGGDTDAFDQTNSCNDWVAYISAYAGRAAHKVPRNENADCHFRDMMLRVAALAVAAIEACDKGWMEKS